MASHGRHWRRKFMLLSYGLSGKRQITSHQCWNLLFAFELVIPALIFLPLFLCDLQQGLMLVAVWLAPLRAEPVNALVSQYSSIHLCLLSKCILSFYRGQVSCQGLCWMLGREEHNKHESYLHETNHLEGERKQCKCDGSSERKVLWVPDLGGGQERHS